MVDFPERKLVRVTECSDKVTKVDVSDLFTPELSDHIRQAVNACYKVHLILELQTGRKWSTLPAFALLCS